MNNYILVDVLMEYIIEGNFEKTYDIVNTIADVNKVCYNGFSMLHHATTNGSHKIVEYLISRGHKTNWRDEVTGATPVHNSVKNGHTKILKMLILNGAEINIKDFAGKEPLHYAAELGNVEIVDLLLSKGRSKIIAMLLRTGADVTSQDNHGRTALHYAAQKGHLDCIELLLSNKYNNLGKIATNKTIDVDIKDENGSTPFFYSILGGHFLLAKKLVSIGANINIRNNHGDSPLIAAATKGIGEIFDFLLSLNADIHNKNNFGNDVFLMACKNGHNNLCVKLLSMGSDINILNNENKNGLILAIENNHVVTSRVLINNGIDIGIQDVEGDTPLLICIKRGNYDIFSLLIDKGADIYITNKNGESVLYAATKHGNPDIFVKLIAVYKRFNPTSELARLAIFNAVKHGHLDILISLIEKGVDIHSRDLYGDTLLHIASLYGYEQIVKYLIDSGVDVNSQNTVGETPMHKAAEFARSTKIVMYLLDKGADLEAEDKNGKNPLNVASKKSQFNVFEILLKNDPENINMRKAMLKAASKLPPSLAKILKSSRKLINKYRTGPSTNKASIEESNEKVNVSTIIMRAIEDNELSNLPDELVQKLREFDSVKDYRLLLMFHWISLKLVEKATSEMLFKHLDRINISNANLSDTHLINAIFNTSQINYANNLKFDEINYEYYFKDNNYDNYVSTLEKFDNFIAPFIENILLEHVNNDIFNYSKYILKRLVKLKALKAMQPKERNEKCKIYEQKANKLSNSSAFNELSQYKNHFYRYKLIPQILKDTSPDKKIGNIYFEKSILEKKYNTIRNGEYVRFLNNYEDILETIEFCKTCINYCYFIAEEDLL